MVLVVPHHPQKTCLHVEMLEKDNSKPPLRYQENTLQGTYPKLVYKLLLSEYMDSEPDALILASYPQLPTQQRRCVVATDHRMGDPDKPVGESKIAHICRNVPCIELELRRFAFVVFNPCTSPLSFVYAVLN